jgi:chaperonin GroEL
MPCRPPAPQLKKVSSPVVVSPWSTPWALVDLKMEVDDEQTGVNIVRKSLEVPMRKIAENAGKDGSVIVQNIRQMHEKDGNNRRGYDVLRDEYIDMVEGGVIDPAKVTRGALENAASIASMILTTEALITDVPEPDRPAAPPMPEY